jgi:hypothetical protein
MGRWQLSIETCNLFTLENAPSVRPLICMFAIDKRRSSDA